MRKQQLLSLFMIFTSLMWSKNGAVKSGEQPPVLFTENKGQICDQNYHQRPDVLFSGYFNGLNYHILRSGVSYQLSRVDKWTKATSKNSTSQKSMPSESTIYRIDVSWLGANIDPVVSGSQEQEGWTNYYLQNCKQGVINVKAYGQLVFSEVYKHIDLKWHGENNGLEYDFIVKPGGDPSQIAVEIKGATKLSIDENGALLISTPLGIITQKKPVAFQNGKEVQASWLMKGGKLYFNLGDYDKTKTLIIDPVLRVWGTYCGDAGIDETFACSTDGSSNVYVVGETSSTNNIATTGAYQTTYSGNTDAFVAKFNSAGIRQWGTYMGGSSLDRGTACVVNNGSTEVYAVGFTMSSGFPITASAHQTVLTGGQDAFIAKFNGSGAIQWCTFYGGTGTEEGYACSLDNSSNIYLSGMTTTTVGTLVATAGAHQTSIGSSIDAFLVKFSSAGVRQWGTYYGGAGNDFGYACSSDVSGNIYMSGLTVSNGTAIATTGAHQTATGGGNDAFLVKFNSAGVRQWGTFYGGANAEVGYACTAFSNNVVYLGGMAAFSTGTVIATTGAHQAAFSSGINDAFLVKFNDLGVRQWGTYYGGVGNVESINGACTNANGDIIVCGSSDGNGLSTPGSHQISHAGTGDAFIAKFNPAGVRQWCSYYGGVGVENGNSCCTNTTSMIFMCGETNSSASIATPGTHQPAMVGTLRDGFLVRFADCPSLTVTIAGTNTLCTGQSATLTATGSGFTTYTWSTASNASSIVVSPTVNTSYTITAGTATAGCVYSDVHTVSVNIQPTVVVTPTSALVCSGNSVTLTASGASTYSWSTGPTTNSIVVTPTAMTQPVVTGINGWCTHSVMANVGVSPTPTINITGAPTVTYCSGGSVTLTASGAVTYTWSNGPTTATNVLSPTVATTYTVTGSAGPCNSTKTISVNMIQTPTVNVNTSAAAICVGGSATLTANGATTYSWNTSATTSVVVVSPTLNTTYTVTGYNGACINSKTIAVTMTTNIAMTAVANPSILCSMSQLTLTSTGATNYTWSTAALTNTDVVSPISSDTYTVYGTSGACTGSAVVSVTVNPLPVVTALVSPTLICVNGTVSLVANGAQTYTWNPGNLNGASQTQTPSSTTVYTVTGTDALLCSNNATVQVTVDPCTGLNESENLKMSLKVIPNPNHGVFSVEGLTKGEQYLIVNALGQIVYKLFADSTIKKFDLYDFTSGVYYLQGKNVSYKFVVLQ